MIKNKAASEFGAMGAKALKEKHVNDPDYFKNLGKRGAEKRWRCRDMNIERVCRKNGLKYLAGGICPCFR